MDAGRAFTFAFQDPRWVGKLLIGAVMLLIPIFGWFVLLGYVLRIIRQVVAGSDLPLPEWEDWGGLFVDGLKLFGVGFVWSLPVSLLSACLQFGLASADDSGTASLLANCITLPLSLAVALVTPAAYGRLAMTGSFAAGLEVGAVLALVRDNIGDYLIVLLMTIVGSLIAAAGIVACCVGVLATTAYAALLTAHLTGQAYRRAQGGTVLLAPTTQF